MPKNTFGFDEAVWEAAKEEACTIMVARAKAEKTISYSELVGLSVTIHLEPRDSRLDHLFGEIARSEDEAGHGMLPVLVVHKTNDQLPGTGFFTLAEELGRDTTDRVAC